MSRTVLVTGVARKFASRAARYLADLAETGPASGRGAITRVIGVDTVVPDADLGGVKFVRADIRTPVIGKVIAVEDVDTVVHLDVNPPMRGRLGGSSNKELNVIGTMQLLAACQRASTVTKLVLGSSTAVYGTSPRDPAMFTESMAARGGVRTGFPKDMVEVEAYTRGFARRRPDIIITTLRAAQALDVDLEMPLSMYLRAPVLPVVAGFDPRLQFVHVSDLLAVLGLAVTRDRPGTFNVAGDGVLMLSQAARRLGRPVIPLPSLGYAPALTRIARAGGAELPPDLHRLLKYGRVVDTTALREVFGYEPTRTTEEIFEEFRAQVRGGVLSGIGER